MQTDANAWMDEDLAVQFHGRSDYQRSRAARFDRYLAMTLVVTIVVTGTVLVTSLASMFIG